MSGRRIATLILAPVTGLAALLSLAAPVAAQSSSQGTATKTQVDAAAIVSRYGLRAIDPPLAAPDFTLPALGGGEASLSDYRGNWVVLTFWATWCGPCRQEMPTLEALHRSREATGLVVLGVSTDAKRSQAEPYVRNEGVTFPNLWDGSGQAARLYQATSIPLSYVVDPRGRLVAVSRGARDWSALAPMLDALQGGSPRDGLPGGGQVADGTPYVGDDAPVELPSVLNPPTAEVALSNPHPRPGHPFFLQVRLHWAGNFEEYLPHPPQVALPEGIVQRLVTASTDSAGGRNQVVYNITLEAREPGTYALDPVELRYTSRFESMPLATQIQGPTVEVQAASMAGLSPALLVGAGLFALALAGTGAFLFLRRRKSRQEAGAEEDPRLAGHRQRLENARSLRLQGRSAAAYAELLELELALGLDDELARAARRNDLEQARYGGVAPPPGELDRLQKQLERRLAERRPDPEQHRRQALKLREQET